MRITFVAELKGDRAPPCVDADAPSARRLLPTYLQSVVYSPQPTTIVDDAYFDGDREERSCGRAAAAVPEPGGRCLAPILHETAAAPGERGRGTVRLSRHSAGC